MAEFLIEDGDWLDVTIISDSPLLEHDAMYMYQQLEKSRHRQLERKALEERRRVLAASAGLSEEELAEREKEQALASKAAQESASKTEQETAVEEKEKEQEKKTPAKKATPKKETKAKAAKGKKADDNADLFEEASEDDDDLF